METKKTRIAAKKAKTAVAAKAKKESPAKKVAEFAVPVFDCKGKEIEQFKLDKKLFDGKVNTAVLYQAVNMYNANKRQGNASTKTRGDVSGGGKKPYRQKGTGRARAGSTRSPLWRHGGIIFGPHPRDYHYDMPKKVKRLAFLSSINSKLNESKLMGITSVELDEPKTKKIVTIANALKLKGKSLFVLMSIDNKVKLASRNIQHITFRNMNDVSTMDILSSDNVVMDKAVLQKLPERVEVA